MGAHSTVDTGATYGSALGRSANVSAANGTALGSSSSVTAADGTAVGTGATVSTAGGVALGQGSKSTRAALDGGSITISSAGNVISSNHITDKDITDKDNSTVNDVYAPVKLIKLINDKSILERVKNTIKGTAGAVSLGNNTTTRQLTNLAPGSADYDAVNVAQLKAVVGTIKHYNVTSKDGDITINPDTTDPNKTVWDLKINPKYKIKYFSVKSEGGANENNDGATATDAIAIGKNASSTGSNAVSLGLGAKALGNNNTAIGAGAQAKDVRTTAVGYNATAEAASAVGIGYEAHATQSRSLAIGQDATASANNAIALGSSGQQSGNDRPNKTTASAEHAVAIGSGAVANIANGIALGSESKTTATSVSGQTGFDASTHDGRANHYSGLNGKTLTSNLAGLSIGNDKKTRQINHLAAGKEDDDAVNVAQLKSVNLAFKGNSGSGDVLLHDQRLSVVGAKDSFITTKASDNKLEVTATTNAVTMNKAEGKANTPTATGLTTNKAVADAINASGWKISQGTTQKDIVNPGDTVSFENGTGTTATVSNKDGKTTTVKYDVAVGKGLEVTDNKVIVKTDGDTITVGTNGELKANLSTEKVKAATGDENIATVTPKEGTENSEFGKKGATYEVAVTKSAVKKVAKTAVKVAAGDNVIVSSKDDATNNETTYTVEAVTPVVYTDKQGKRVYKVKDGNGYKFTKNADGTGEVVNKSDVIASFYDGNNSATAGTMIVNNVGSAINSTILPEGKANNFLNKLEVAASAAGTPNAAVNVSDLHNTADALRSNEWHITPTESGKPYTVKDNKVT